LATLTCLLTNTWGAQTQRSFQNFKIGGNLMPTEIIRAFAILKKAAAITNHEAGVLCQKEKSDLIGKVCDEILERHNSTINSLWWSGKQARELNPT
jgi:fumarate hydratase class II